MVRSIGICSTALILWGITAAGVVRSDGPAWPAQANESKTNPVSKRLADLDRALEILRKHLQVLQKEVETGLGQDAQSPRRGEEGFRAIYAMNRDGTGVEFLAAAPAMLLNMNPRWSHDGKLIVFNSRPALNEANQSKIFVYAIAGPFKGQYRDLDYGHDPDWSPDDRKIAYMINPDNPIGAQDGLWVMDTDGSNRRWLAKGWFPRWSPDGKQVLFQGPVEGGSDTLIIADVETAKSRVLLKADGWTLKNYGGEWSSDGRQIVFIGTHAGQDRLATIDAGGKDDSIRTLYTNEEPAIELFGPPAWSPDGKQVVFVKQATNGQRLWENSYLYSMRTDAPGEPTLLEGKKVGTINRGMAFSPDSKRVLFSSER